MLTVIHEKKKIIVDSTHAVLATTCFQGLGNNAQKNTTNEIAMVPFGHGSIFQGAEVNKPNSRTKHASPNSNSDLI